MTVEVVIPSLAPLQLQTSLLFSFTKVGFFSLAFSKEKVSSTKQKQIWSSSKRETEKRRNRKRQKSTVAITFCSAGFKIVTWINLFLFARIKKEKKNVFLICWNLALAQKAIGTIWTEQKMQVEKIFQKSMVYRQNSANNKISNDNLCRKWSRSRKS